MQKSKRGHIWIGLGIALFLIVCGVIIYLVIDSEPEPKDGIQYLNEDVDLACLVYGDNYNMGELNYERVTSIDTETVLRDNDYVYLLMFDMSGEGNITREDAFRLIKLADENPNFNFFYVGKDAMSFFQEVRGSDSQPITDSLIWGYCYHRSAHFGELLLWTQEDMERPNSIPEEDIPQFIETVIHSNVKENEK